MAETDVLVQYISDLEDQQAIDRVKALLAEGVDADAILTTCRLGLDEVGKRFESSEYFLADLMFAAEMFEEMLKVLTPDLEKGAAPGSAGRVVIATVKNDIHDIGKNLVATILRAGGFEVIDLGVDVPPGKIYQATRAHKPDVVALSCLLTNGLDSMEDTIKGFSAEGLRDQVKILVGGIPLSARLADQMGADAYGENANQGLARCRELVGGTAG